MVNNLDVFMNRVRGALDRGLKVAGDDLVIDIQVSLSTPFPPASVAGEAPHRRTGELHDSIQDTVADNRLRVFSDDPKSMWLEEGTDKIAPRPHFRPALTRNSDIIGKTVIDIAKSSLD